MLRRFPFFSRVFPFFLLFWGVLAPLQSLADARDFKNTLAAYNSSLSTIFPGDGLIPRSAFSEDLKVSKEEIREVKKALESAFGYILVSEKTVENTYKAVSYLLSIKDYLFHGNSSIYVYPQPGIFSFAFQMYKDGTVFIHLGDRDPKKANGGFKRFSRSLCLKDKKLYGSLYFSLSDESKVKDLKEELEIMEAMKRVPHNLSFSHFGVYKLPHGSGLSQYEGVFQTKLFQSTLGRYKIGKTSLSDLYKLMYQAALSVNGFHKKGYAHRDIKEDNFFVNYLGHEKFELVLADYGLAEKSSFMSTHNSLVGTKGYKDPYFCELERIDFERKLNFNEKKESDIFALGMVFYRMLYYDRSLKNIVYNLNIEARMKYKGFDSCTDYSETDLKKRTLLQRNWVTERNIKIEDFYKEYDASHKKFFGLAQGKEKESYTGEAVVPNFLRRMVLSMISPRPKERPSIKKVIQLLKKLKKHS